MLNQELIEVDRIDGNYKIKTTEAEYLADKIVSTIPVQELTKLYKNAANEIGGVVKELKYNSIIIAFVKTKKDLSGANFAFMTADKNILFHRISKMDFLGDAYKSAGATYMVEVTFRQKDWIDQLSETELKQKITEGLEAIQFIDKPDEAEFINITKHPYAYVIYDLNHQRNMEAVRAYYSSQGVYLNGRFGNFEYWNMDRVLRESKNLAAILSGEDNKI